MSEDIIYREDAIKAINARADWYQVTCNGKQVDVMLMAKDVNEILEKVPSADRPQGEWVDCKEPPSTYRNVFIAYGTDDMKSVCIGHYRHDLKLWYEDKNFFATPIYDAMYWCEIPQFPTRMKGADDE